MKVKILCGIMVVLLGFASLYFARNTNNVPGTDQMNSDEEREQILNDTLQIKMEIPYTDEGITNAVLRATGLGSLIQCGGETLLVTHNHWGSVLQEKSVVELYDARGRKVKTMSGAEFISLMIYLDAGTLILRSPVEWKAKTQPILESDAHKLQAGDIVMVAQQMGYDQMGVALIEAEVESIATIRGLSVYQLKGLDGKPVQAGDSGGGVWYQKKLTGNTWYAMMVGRRLPTPSIRKESDEVTLEATEESYAAILPTITQISQPFVEPVNERGAK
jgi:hypothetical protein